MKAVKFWEENNLEGMPTYWFKDLADITEAQQDHFLDLGYTIYSDENYSDYYLANVNAYNLFMDAHVVQLNNNKLRVTDLIQDDFRNFHESKIDFTVHLTPGTCLNKKTTMLSNGRPSVAKYYLGTELPENLIAEIVYEFDNNSSGFMIERREKLAYYKNDGNKTEYYLIHQRKYNFSIPYEASESLRERVQARDNIFQEIKIVLNGFLIGMYMTQGQTLSQAAASALNEARAFFNTYRIDVENFIELSLPDFKNNIGSDVFYLWLNLDIQTGITARQYVQAKLTY